MRYIGTETEFGITCPDNPVLSPIVTSTHVVVNYAAAHTAARSRWDFVAEHPLRDSRGFDLKRYSTVPVVDPNAIGVANVVTESGARFYVDHAHPEYSSPECSTPWEAMVYDVAGNEVALRALRALGATYQAGASVLAGHEPCPPVRLYKNNVDGKGASYGAHENYLYRRGEDSAACFETMAAALIPFFTARVVIVGAGRVGLGVDGEETTAAQGFQISQRADYIEQEISLETTLNRGIINTRDEPHAATEEWGRLHVIVGDANLAHTSILLKLGMTAAVLDAWESGVDFSDLQLADAVSAIKAFSRDVTLQQRVPLRDGRELSALDIVEEYRLRCLAALEKRPDFAATYGRVFAEWEEVMALLRRDPLLAADRLDWVAKYRLLKGFVDRGLGWDDPKLAAVDIQYADIDPARSLYSALVKRGALRTLATTEEIMQAATAPPRAGRAAIRGLVTRRFAHAVRSASWQHLWLELDASATRGNPADSVGAVTAGANAAATQAASASAFLDFAEVDLLAECVEQAARAESVTSLVDVLTGFGVTAQYR